MKLKIFFSYGRYERERDAAKKIVSYLKGNSALDIFWDYKLKAGEDWETRVLSEAQAANVFIFLIGNHSLQSNNCINERLAFQNGTAGDLLLPVYFQECAHLIEQRAPFDTLQGIPTDEDNGRLLPYIDWPDHDKACERIAVQILEAVDSLLAAKQARIRETVRSVTAKDVSPSAALDSHEHQLLFRAVLDRYLAYRQLKRMDLETFPLGKTLLENYYRDKHLAFLPCFITNEDFRQQLAGLKGLLNATTPDLLLIPFQLYKLDEEERVVLNDSEIEVVETINTLKKMVTDFGLDDRIRLINPF